MKSRAHRKAFAPQHDTCIWQYRNGMNSARTLYAYVKILLECVEVANGRTYPRINDSDANTDSRHNNFPTNCAFAFVVATYQSNSFILYFTMSRNMHTVCIILCILLTVVMIIILSICLCVMAGWRSTPAENGTADAWVCDSHTHTQAMPSLLVCCVMFSFMDHTEPAGDHHPQNYAFTQKMNEVREWRFHTRTPWIIYFAILCKSWTKSKWMRECGHCIVYGLRLCTTAMTDELSRWR